MRRVLLLVLYRSLWFSLFWGLGMMWKRRRNGKRAVPAGVQRWIGILCALWLALLGTVSMSIRYRVDASPVRGNTAKVLSPAVAVPVSAVPVQNVSLQIQLLDVVAIIWLAGAAVVFLFHMGAYLRTCRSLRRWKTGEMTRSEGNQGVRIAYTCSADVPMTEGLLRPVIWFPDSWREKDCGYALLHEMTHIRRGDVWVKWLLLWVKSLYWFQPLVFRFSRWAAETLEYACDEQVVREASPEQRREYCLAILEAAGQGQYRMFADGFLRFAEERSKMVSRIERIMNLKKESGFPLKKKLGICLLAVLLTGCSVLNLQVEEMPVPTGGRPEGETSAGMSEVENDRDDKLAKMSEPVKPAKKEDETVRMQADNQTEQDEAPVGFQLEMFPCEAYKVVFPAWYKYKDKEETIINELIFYANPGVEVRAIFDETVIETGQVPFVGKYVITESDGYQMRYCHFKEITINVGDVLKQGDTIGFVGTIGAATCYQCELRIQRKDGSPVDLSQYADSIEGYEDGEKTEIICENDYE